ncbi:MAG TPA: FecR family protein [Verrucomicrobiae bacterium]|nr:FecR family protein [Verrucomicrobiae bacterium]
MNKLSMLLAATLSLSFPFVVAAQGEPVGEVALVTGLVTVAGEGAPRSLGKGDAIYEGMSISVGANSYANLKFKDGGRVLLRPSTEFAVESFRYAAAAVPAPVTSAPPKPATATTPTGGNAFFRLVRGGFRAVSGLIGKGDQQAYRVTTPAATIGIRGTDYEVQVCTDDCPNQAQAIAGGTEVASTTLEGIQLAQAGGNAGGGLIVATNEGSIVLRTSRGDTVVDVGQVALALANGQTFMLPAVPDVMLRNSTPPPEECQ